MQYCKPGLTIEQQADHLLGMGLIEKREVLIAKLNAVSYFRLSGYWYPFKDRILGRFREGTTFNAVWRRYTFDRRLRVIVLDAIERIEVYVRSNLSNKLALAAKNCDPFEYSSNRLLFPNCSASQYAVLQGRFAKDHKLNKTNDFIVHFDKTYGDCHNDLPIWMAVEVMTLGTVEDMYKAVSPTTRKEIANALGVQDGVFGTWLKTLRTVRNLVAHHGRLWNRVVRMKPQIPNKDAAWRTPVPVQADKLFGVLTICMYLMRRIAPESAWKTRLVELFDEYPDIDKREMGFPGNWEQCPIWCANHESWMAKKLKSFVRWIKHYAGIN